mgnify:CR=1 FL=1
MSKKWLALGLVLALLLGLCAGCSSSSSTASEPAAQTESAPTAEAAAPATEAAAPEAEPAAPAEESAAPAQTPAAPAEPSGAGASAPGDAAIAAPEATSGAFVSPGGIEYPIGDGSQEVTFWVSYGGFWTEYIGSMDEILLRPYIVDYTGVNYTFIECPESAATEQFSLMVASGDWPDTVQATDYYNGGLGQAYEDEFVADLTDLLETDAPDYYAALNGTNETTVKSLLTDGKSLAVYSIKDMAFNDRGGALRADWAEELGYNVDELTQGIGITTFTDLLYDMLNAYHGDYTLYMGTGASTAAVGQAFGVSLPSIASPTALTYYRDGDQILSSFTQQGFRDYLEWFRQLYADGIINNEFYVSDMVEGEMFTKIGDDQMGVWTTAANVIEGVKDYTGLDIPTSAIPNIVADDKVGEITEWGSDTVLADNKGYSICADVDDIDFVLNFYNYFYTKPGAIFCNYGVEGLTWEYQEDGTIDYSDKIYHDPEGTSPMVAQNLYTFSMIPRFMYETTKYVFYNDASLAALDVWLVKDYLALHNIPTDAALTTEETNSIKNEVNDILAYTSEQLLKFMTGTDELNDQTWDAYCTQCSNLGLDTCMALYQNAYEEYLRGERVAAPSAGGDSPPPPPDGEGGPPPAP